MISYAQNFEDVILWRIFQEQSSGFYIDIGANDPLVANNTRHFYEQGWSGINIEPGIIFRKLEKHRVRDINLNLAVSDQRGEQTLYEYPDGHGLASLSPKITPAMQPYASNRYARIVPTRRLAEILDTYAWDRVIDFMTIDVEGHEQAVLKSNDWDRYRPRVILVEATSPLTTEPTHESWEPILLQARYQFVYFDGLNRYYIRAEEPELAQYFHRPVCVFDNYITYEVEQLRLQCQEMEGDIKRALQEQADWEDKYHDVLAECKHWRYLTRRSTGRCLLTGLWLARQLTTLLDWIEPVRNLFGYRKKSNRFVSNNLAVTPRVASNNVSRAFSLTTASE